MIKGLRYYLKRREHSKLFAAAGIEPNDVFLASYPKSGNTWLRYILARALYPADKITPRNLQEFFPTVHRSSAAEINKLASPRYIKTHAPFFDMYPKCIYIIRDYRAVVVSAWFHAQRTASYKGTLSEFAESSLLRSFGPWHWHVEEALKHSKINPEGMLILKYESMLTHGSENIGKVLRFCNIDPIISIGEIEKLTSIENLRQTEKKTGSRSTDQSGEYFFRKGSADDWKNHLTAALEERLISGPTKTIMQKCGYLPAT